MITLNCDIGERGADHPTDIELMRYVGIANIACGGHAGDETSVKAFLERARDLGVKVAAHISYPDREHFGRKTMSISPEELIKSLQSQHAMMPKVKTIKLHGALYNDANVDRELAELLAEWMKGIGVQEVITLPDSELAKVAAKAGLNAIGEAYAERNYMYNVDKKQLLLVSRTKDYACITDCDEAAKHAMKIIRKGMVTAYSEDAAGKVTRIELPLKAETICIHSDSKISLELAKTLAARL